MRSLAWLTFLALGLVRTGYGQERLTLQGAVDQALQSHPALQEAHGLTRAAAARVEQARAARLPRLSFQETFTHGNNPVFAFGKKLEQARFDQSDFALEALNRPGALSNFRSSLELHLPIFSAWQIDSGLAQAREGRAVAVAQEVWAAQQVRFQVVRTYFGVLLTQSRLEVAVQALESARAEASRMRDRYQEGMVVLSDVMAMEVQAAEFEQRLIQSRGEVETAWTALNLAMGRPLSQRPALAGSLEDRPFQAASADQLIESALRGRGDLRAARGQIEMGRQEIRKARGRYLPQLGIFAEFGQSSQDLSGGSSDFALGARLTFDLVDFGRAARVRQAEAEREASRARERALEDQVSLAVVQALQDFRSARESLQVATRAVEQAGETLRIVEDRHRVGLTDVTEVLRAQTASVRARTNRLAARYAVHVGYARLLLESGNLRDTGAFQ